MNYLLLEVDKSWYNCYLSEMKQGAFWDDLHAIYKDSKVG